MNVSVNKALCPSLFYNGKLLVLDEIHGLGFIAVGTQLINVPRLQVQLFMICMVV